MTRYLKYFLCTILCILIVTSLAFAEDDITIQFNGEKIETSTPPVIVDGRTLVPMRMIFNLFDFEVDWESDTKTAIGRKGTYEIRLPIGSKSVSVGGEEQTLDVPAQILANSTYIPLRFVSESIGAYVDWDGHHRTVSIASSYLDQELEVKDTQLEDALKSVLNIPTDTDLTVGDVKFIQEIDLSKRNIYKLDGFESFVNLKDLKLSNNFITTLTPLENLTKLEKLDLSNNLIKDSQDLRNLRNLSYLNLKNNDLDDLVGIQNLTNLNELYLIGNDLNYEDDYSVLYYFDDSLKIDVDRSYFEEPEYNTYNLRKDAGFTCEIESGIWWVPANRIGGTDLLNEDVDDLFVNTPQGRATKIDTLFELIQMLSHMNFDVIDDDIIQKDDESRLWRYHKTPYATLKNYSGSEKAFAIACASMLERDYDETGVMVIIDEALEHRYVNYIKHGNAYYVYHPLQYLESNQQASAIEDGYLDSYSKSPGLDANVHHVEDLMTFAKAITKDDISVVYKIIVFGGIDVQYPEATYDIDRGANGDFIFIPKDDPDDDDDYNYWHVRLETLYNNDEDMIYFKGALLDLSNPSWK